MAAVDGGINMKMRIEITDEELIKEMVRSKNRRTNTIISF